MNQDFSGMMPEEYNAIYTNAGADKALLPATTTDGGPAMFTGHDTLKPWLYRGRQPCSCVGADVGDEDGCGHEHGARVCISCEEAATSTSYLYLGFYIYNILSRFIVAVAVAVVIFAVACVVCVFTRMYVCVRLIGLDLKPLNAFRIQFFGYS